MFKAVKKDGVLKQVRPDGTIEENSNLQENAGIEDWSTENEINTDSDGIVITEKSGNDEVTSGLFLNKKNLKMETVKAILTKVSETPKIDLIVPLPIDPAVLINANKINQMINDKNDFIDFSKEELDKM